MSDKTIAPGRQPIYGEKLFEEHVHDAYKSSRKLPSPTRCPDCGAVFADGRWQWLGAPADAHAEPCPACHRVRDRFPAGFVTVEGEFALEHAEELTSLVRNVEAKEKAEHPLKRIMEIRRESGGLLITTTDVHLAHGIGEALHHAYKGTLDSRYNREENLLRVHWTR